MYIPHIDEIHMIEVFFDFEFFNKALTVLTVEKKLISNTLFHHLNSHRLNRFSEPTLHIKVSILPSIFTSFN